MKAATLILLLSILAVPALSQSDPGSDIEATIGRQIEALQADDFETAFTFASPGIQGVFGTSERFGAMVRQGYPMVWRPSEVQFLDLENRGGLLFQKVLVRDAAGAVHVLEYQMVRVGETWRINGVRLLRPTGVGA